jgi:hypothetical protein
MTISVKDSQQFKINELVVVTKNGDIDISAIYEEISIYDSLFVPVMSGKILIKDSIGLSSKLLFDGSEALLMDIVKDPEASQPFNFKKAFRIYKQSERSDNTMSSETYILSFVSDELIFSDQQRINQAYEMNYTNMVKNILANYLKVPENQLGGIYDETVGIRKVVIPNLRPLEAIEWCAKRSVDERQAPCFMFYQNLTGYNFASLSKLLVNPIVLDIKFEPKNTSDVDALDEISSARSLEIVGQTDAMDKTRSGVTSGKFIGFDPMMRMIADKKISYDDHYKLMDHANENPNVSVIPNRDKQDNVTMFNAKKTVSTFAASRQYSEYIKKKDPTSLSKEDNIEQYLFQRRALLKNLMERRVKLTMPGNFQLTSGFNVYLNVLNIAKKSKDSGNEDKSLTGKYIIVASRHIIGYEKFQTIIEVATTSTDNEFVPVGNIKETQEILEY